MAKKIEETLENVAKPLVLTPKITNVVLVVGVNGTGKTTTIGKLANQYSNEGKKIMIAACDTFRAAATEQLEIWAQRSNAEFVKGSQGCDAAGLAYEALEKAKAKKSQKTAVLTNRPDFPDANLFPSESCHLGLQLQVQRLRPVGSLLLPAELPPQQVHLLLALAEGVLQARDLPAELDAPRVLRPGAALRAESGQRGTAVRHFLQKLW